jgi:hypothetical protein
MSNDINLVIIDKISSVKLKIEQLDMVPVIANIFHDVWRQSWGKNNGSDKYTNNPFYVKDTNNIKINVNVPYNELPPQFTDLNINLITFGLQLVSTNPKNPQLCYYLINEYRRIINTSERGSSKDVIFNMLPEKDKYKCIDIFNICNAFKNNRLILY